MAHLGFGALDWTKRHGLRALGLQDASELVPVVEP